MQIAYKSFIVLGALVALIFSVLVLLTGKGDAMSGGGGGIRTTFRGKASFDDFVSKLILYLGIAFMIVMVLLDWMSSRLPVNE